MSSPYLLDNTAPQTADRFASLQTLFDPVTVRHLEAIDVQAGWRCLEVGAGSGSIARWLATRTGPTGHVLATDLDPHRITTDSANGQATIEVRRHDITLDPLPASGFDLIHARLVLIHLADRQTVLTHMVTALKPGGHLLIEDFDTTGHSLRGHDPHDDDLLNTVSHAFSSLLTARGADGTYSRRLPHLLTQAGLSDVRADGHVAIDAGGSPIADMNWANIQQTRDQLIATGLLTAEQIDQFLHRVTDPRVTLIAPLMISATGRRPLAPPRGHAYDS